MPRFTGVEYNVQHTDSLQQISNSVDYVTGMGSVVGLCEVQGARPSRAVNSVVRHLGWQQAMSQNENRLLWDPAQWSPMEGATINKKVADGAAGRGNPPRFLLGQGLICKEDQSTHLFIVTHAVASYAKKGEQSHDEYRDEAAVDHFLKLLAFSAMAVRSRMYKFIHMWGDLNSWQKRDEEWWYPSRVLQGVYAADMLDNSLDWMLHTWSSQANGLRTADRRQVRSKHTSSDHPLNLKKMWW